MIQLTSNQFAHNFIKIPEYHAYLVDKVIHAFVNVLVRVQKYFSSKLQALQIRHSASARHVFDNLAHNNEHVGS